MRTLLGIGAPMTSSSSSNEEVESERRLEAAAFAYGAGVLPLVVASMFGLPTIAVLAANVVGAGIAAWRSSPRPLVRAAYVIPALVFSLGISISCLHYLNDAAANVEVTELFFPAVLGGIPGAILWWLVTKLLR